MRVTDLSAKEARWGEESIGLKAAYRHCLVRVTFVLFWGSYDHESLSAKGRLVRESFEACRFHNGWC